MTMAKKTAQLILGDGTVWEGEAFGADVSVSGEAVFQTGMVGYTEALTDPSYSKQILVLTYPLIGNYGVPGDDKDELGILKYFESNKVHVAALVVATLSEDYSHCRAVQSLHEWLKKEGIPGITGIDTRALTKNLREHGCMLGKVVMFGTDPAKVPMEDPNKINLVAHVSIKAPQVYNAGAAVKITMVDCGMKLNQLRCLCARGAQVTVVPWDYDFVTNNDWDGLFLSNGPGDPAMASKTIDYLKILLADMKSGKSPLKPIFGICLGHQLLSLAAGAETYKLPYGNRGHNQPCMEVGTKHCFITSQNHGFAVDEDKMPAGWLPLFRNANDNTNEGIVHENLPFFSVQFHPEAMAGPEDTESLFDVFINASKSMKAGDAKLHLRTLLKAQLTKMIGIEESSVPPLTRPRKVLVLGSGGLSIGQAGEFDYSGSQAVKAMREEGIQTVLINPNVATVQTAKGLADKVYFLPVTPEYVIQVLKHERPDGILLAFGGQTALNCGIVLHRKGILVQYNCRVLGTPVDTIISTEDREIFSRKLAEINECSAPSFSAETPAECETAALKIGFPVICRAAYALGGLGSGFANNCEELAKLVNVSFSQSPQVLVEKSLRGWKEIEYEVVRDAFGNCITVCNMENFDPLGIHTGESIVVAPSQTLDNHDYNMLRNTAVKVVRHLGVVGECNIQYALDKDSQDYCIIEVNPRLSRSSALASKATGYPLAAVAAKLALGIELDKIPNAVTKVTSAAFEPSLDYCVVKYPRWDLSKFSRVEKQLGPQMRSVGEVMSIARDFTEGLQKAMRMVDSSWKGFQPMGKWTDEEREIELRAPTPMRIYALADAFYNAGYSVDRVHEITKIDRWFLSKLEFIAVLSNDLNSYNIQTLPRVLLVNAKKAGFSDLQIAERIQADELSVRQLRKEQGIFPVVKQIDTLAAEFPAQTNYLYMTYNGAEHDVIFDDFGTLVVGCGTYRIGSSVEFDYGSVLCLRTLVEHGKKTVMINCNPETVSTDFDESDRLYFEELSLERVMDVYELEGATGVVVSFGGQTPNNLAVPLDKWGANVLGTSPAMIDNAEDRNRHSAMLDQLGIDQPLWSNMTTIEDAKVFCNKVGYPVLVRPSYVLSGAAMNVVRNEEELKGFLDLAVEVSDKAPVVISKFMEGSEEIDIDAVANKGEVIAYAIAEHIEQGGIHSGDATLALPARELPRDVFLALKDIAFRIAKRLEITGPFNMQVLRSTDGSLKVIETNVRASRSLPFCSKVLDVDFCRMATLSIIGLNPGSAIAQCDKQQELPYVGVKVPQFSFKRLPGADPTLGVEMSSTGEVACFHPDKYGAYLRALQSTYMRLPKPGEVVYVTLPDPVLGQHRVDKVCKAMAMWQSIGYKLAAGTADVQILAAKGVKDVTEIAHNVKDGEPRLKSDAVKAMKAGGIQFVMELSGSTAEISYICRRAAIDFSVPLVTNIEQCTVIAEALQRHGTSEAVVPRGNFQEGDLVEMETYEEVMDLKN
mmetsp:Transcript_8150/g.18911  ORF Transcript_8150/g.18911 Transcript_8150/m.18911 type:complete len:1493 (+) Transcript_8150:195-4673(+)